MPPFELTAFSLISISHSSLSSLLPFANTILVGFYRYSKISRYFCFTLLTRFYKMDCLLLEFFGITWLVFCHHPLLQRVYQISLLQLYQTGGISKWERINRSISLSGQLIFAACSSRCSWKNTGCRF